MAMATAPLLSTDRVDSALDLLSAAAGSLTSAHLACTAHDRSAGTRLAVLRAAAAVLAVRGRPAETVVEVRAGEPRNHPTPTSGPADVWDLLPRVAPELTEWAEFFAAVLPPAPGSRDARADGRTQTPRPGSVREVDDLLRQGEEFVRAVAATLGLPPVPVTAELVSLTGSRYMASMATGAGGHE